ncbi:hypothetical protein [Robertkochia flava]|uniref:hypothetical protein n=1 Tax=Robertkochia flava TaxID=3447986 RepID=UPI001CCFB7C1|nr:hypothetical protein [Robertkochia marina]
MNRIFSSLPLVLLMFLFLFSCREDSRKDHAGAGQEVSEKTGDAVDTEPDVSRYDPATSDTVLAGRISEKLRELFREDLEVMTEFDRRYQFYKVNLDTDASGEVLIRFLSPYFCGSGGCTLLALDNDLSLITRFTVTRPPIFVEQRLENNWKVLMVRSGGQWKALVNTGDGYPGNPTVLPPAPYDAPSGNAEVVFGDMKSSLPAMTYSF